MRKAWGFQLRHSRLLTVLSVTLAVATGVLVSAGAASAQPNFEVLHVFTGGADGGLPDYAPLIQAADGNFYGTTTLYGGTSGLGTVFQMNPSGSVTVLHTFGGGSDGLDPGARLVPATDGNLYGTTSKGGGLCNCGTVFKMTLSGSVTV